MNEKYWVHYGMLFYYTRTTIIMWFYLPLDQGKMFSHKILQGSCVQWVNQSISSGSWLNRMDNTTGTWRKSMYLYVRLILKILIILLHLINLLWNKKLRSDHSLESPLVHECQDTTWIFQVCIKNLIERYL